jgi:hypothetical protein
VPYAVALTTYTNPTIVGELWLSVVNGTNSNTFKAYARTLTAGNASNVALRLLTGTADEAFGALTSGSAFTLQGTVKYTTTSANGNIGVPTSYIAANFRQDVYGNVGLNTGASNIRAKFDVIQNSNIPALVVDQYGTGDALQVKDGGVTKMVVDGSGNVGIGATAPISQLDILIPARTTEFVASNVLTWSDIHIRNPTDTQNAATGIRFVVDSSVNATAGGAGIAAIKAHPTANVFDLAFITDPVGVDSAEAMRITSTGNVGIGTTNPQAKLDVNGFANFKKPLFIGFVSFANNSAQNGTVPIPSGNVSIDTVSAWSGVTNRYTPNVAGYYLVTGFFGINVTSSIVQLVVKKNNGNNHISCAFGNSQFFPFTAISTMHYLNGSTDYINFSYDTTGNGNLSGTIQIHQISS